MSLLSEVEMLGDMVNKTHLRKLNQLNQTKLNMKPIKLAQESSKSKQKA